MGMFDEITLQEGVLEGMTEEEMVVDRWQTKDFDCELDRYLVNKEGMLMKFSIEMEVTPDDELPYPERPFIGSFREVIGSEKWVPFHHTGIVNIYSSIQGVWTEYEFTFYNGLAIGIIPIIKT